MKTEFEIDRIISNIPSDIEESNFRAMTYEDGVRNALQWVKGNIPDDEFIDSKGELI